MTSSRHSTARTALCHTCTFSPLSPPRVAVLLSLSRHLHPIRWLCPSARRTAPYDVILSLSRHFHPLGWLCYFHFLATYTPLGGFAPPPGALHPMMSYLHFLATFTPSGGCATFTFSPLTVGWLWPSARRTAPGRRYETFVTHTH